MPDSSSVVACPAGFPVKPHLFVTGSFVCVSHLVLSAQSATKDHIRAEHKLHSISKISISQVIIPQVMFLLLLLLLLLAYLYSAGTQHGNLHPVG